MTQVIERRDFIKSIGLVAGIAGGFDAQSNIRRCAGRTATGSKIHGL